MCVYKTEDGKCKKFSDDKTNSWCVNGPCEYEKLSNCERIKNMNVEEMTDFLNNICTSLAIKVNGEYIVREAEPIKQWLEREAE